MNLRLNLIPALLVASLCAWAAPPLQKATVSPHNLRQLAPARTAGAAASLPAEFAMSSAEEFATYQIIDANGDGKTWKFENGYPTGSPCYEGLGTTSADDWMILGKVDFPNPAATYEVSIEAKVLLKSETYQVCLSPTGQTADALPVLTHTLTDMNFTPATATFTLPSAGEWTVMVHAISPEAGISLYVKNLKIQQAASSTPTPPLDIEPTASDWSRCIVVDANGDGSTWTHNSNPAGVNFTSNRQNPADDYLLLPEVEYPAAGNYEVSFSLRGYGSNTEALALLLGQGEDPASYTEIWHNSSFSDPEYGRRVVYSIPEPGVYRLALKAFSPANQYLIQARNFHIQASEDSPAQPLPFSNTAAVTAGSDTKTYAGPFILPSEGMITISFTLQGDPVSLALTDAEGAPVAKSLFTAENPGSVSRTISSPASGTKYIVLESQGESEISDLQIAAAEGLDPYPLPFSMQPTAEQFLEMSVIDANGDGSTWSYYEPFGAVRYNYSTTNDADDWLILPPILLPETDRLIRFSAKSRGMSTRTMPETFVLYAGPTPDPASMKPLYASPQILWEEFTPIGGSFASPGAGLTYFAIKATSKANAFHLFLRDLEIALDERPSSIPSQATDLQGAQLPMGSTKVKVSFTMPFLTAAGQPLDPQTPLKATLTSVQESVQTEALPGASAEMEIESGQGWNTLSLTIANSQGATDAQTLRVYAGQDKPKAVTDVRLTPSRDNMSVAISWTQPSEGENGGYVDPQTTTYLVRHAAGSGSAFTTVETLQGLCETTYTLPAGRPLDMHFFTIVSSGPGGETEQPRMSGLMLGTPHKIPAREDFTGGEIALGPIGMAHPTDLYTLDWYFENPAALLPEAKNESGLALIAFTEEEGAASGRLHLPKFDTRTESGARLALRVWNHPHFAPTRIWVETWEGEPLNIGTIAPSTETGWHEYSFPLPEKLLGKEWVAPYLDFTFPGTADDEVWMLDRFAMENYHDTELDLRPHFPPTDMQADEPTRWTFTASNCGRLPLTVDVPQLCFATEQGDAMTFPEETRAGEQITLQPGESTRLYYTATLHAGMEGMLAWDLSMPLDSDGNPDNNYVADQVRLHVQKEYVVRDLQARRSEPEENVLLTWSAPDTDWGITYADNFESWIYGSRIGLFTNLDRDALPTCTFSGMGMPGAGEPKAWQVFDWQQGGFDPIYAGYLGTDKSLIAFCPADPQAAADDWLISPEVKGGTMLTFYVRPLNYQYGRESIEVLTSSTGTEPSDFRLLDTYQTLAGEKGKTPYWEEAEYTLPADTRFFALRYCSRDIFGLQLDDIIYTPAQAEATDITYTLLRGGEPVQTGLTQTSTTDVCPEGGFWQVAAEKAYGGLHPLSNRVELATLSAAALPAGVKVSTLPGLLHIRGLQGSEALSLHEASGIEISLPAVTSEMSIPLKGGIYMLRIGEQTLKIVITD